MWTVNSRLPYRIGYIPVWSEWQDSNLRPLASKASALAKLSYIPMEDSSGYSPLIC